MYNAMLSAFICAPTIGSLSGSSNFKPMSDAVGAPSSMASSVVRVAVVGDVHDYWNLEEDTKALQLLQPDLVLFTDLKFSKAVILGNHDAWDTQKFNGKRKDGVQLQLEILGEEHVGYQRLDFSTLKLSVVGGRPFSCGGKQLFRKRLLLERYGVQDMDVSAKRIYNGALGTPGDHLVIFLAHNGPTGLGSEANDICGRDWVFGGGDHGDPDLAQALSCLKETTKLCIPLVVFGHMHKELAHGNGLRKMVVSGSDNTVYLNGAIVPRVKRLSDEQATAGRSFRNSETSVFTPETGSTMRAFTLVEILDGAVDKITESWVSVLGDRATLAEEHILFESGG